MTNVLRKPIPFGTASLHTELWIAVLVVALLFWVVNVAVASDSGLNLTPEERAWLDAHPEIRARVGDAPPLHFFDGEPRGIAVDYLNLIAERVGFDVEYVYGIPWSTALEDIRDHEVLDVILTAKRTAEREDDMAFTENFLLMPWVIFTQKDKPVAAMNELAGQIVSVERDFVMHKKLADEYPSIVLLVTETSREALEAVATGEADAYIGNLTTGSYIMQYYNLINLQVSAPTPFENHDQAIAVRDDWPELVSILNKGFASITEAERVAIHQKWVPVLETVQPAPTPGLINSWHTVGLGVAIILVFLIALWLLMRFVGNRLPAGLRTAHVQMVGMVVMVSFLTIVIGGAWLGLNSIKHRMGKNIGESLQMVVETTHQSIKMWVEGQKEHLEEHAKDPRLVALVQGQLEVPRTRDALLASDSLRKLRAYLDTSCYYWDLGFFVIAPDRIIIASRRDANVGSRNLIDEQRPAELQKAFSGKIVFIPSIYSDVPLPDASGRMQTVAPTMFIAVPIRDSGGAVIAVLTLRLDPGHDFTRLCLVARMGQTGETYAFDGTARLLSETRFAEDLVRTGLVEEGQQAGFQIRISDPGGNLLEGHQSSVPPREQPLTYMAAEATAGRSGVNVDGYHDYRGVQVFGAWVWDQNLHIGLATEIDKHEAWAAYQATRNIVVGILAVTILLAFLLTAYTIWSGERTNRTLRQARDEWERIAEGRTADLRALSERLGLATSAANIGVWDWDITRNVLIWDEEMYALYDTNKDDSRGAHEIWIQGVHPDDKEMLEQQVQTALQDERTPDIEFRIIWHDGTIRYIREVSKVSRDENGKINRMIGVVWDITERKLAEIELQAHAAELKMSNEALEKSKRAALSLMQDANVESQRAEKSLADLIESQEALRESEEHSRLLLDSAAEGILGVGPDGNVTFSNPAATRILGFSAAELLGHDIHEMIHHSHVDGTPYPVAECPMTKTYIEGTRHHIEDEVLWRKDGTSFYTDYTSTPIRKDQELVGTVIMFSDITERKEFERLSLLIRQRLETLLRVTEYEITNVTDFLDHALQEALDITSSRFGYIYFYDEATKEFELNTWSKQVMPECQVIDPHTKYALDKTGMWGEVVRQRKSMIVNDYSLQHPLAKGTPEGHVPLERFMSVPVFEEGKIVAVVGVANRTEEYDEIDVRQLGLLMNSVWKMVRAFEYRGQLIVARDAAKAANRAKSDFLANMSHELRTPLNAIIGFSEILIDEKLGSLLEKQKRSVGNVLTAGRHLLALINDILDLAKIEAGKMELELGDVEVGTLLRESLVLIQEKAMKHSIRLHTEMEDCIAELKMQADARKLKQILYNLLSNAAKFTPDGGEITIGARYEEDILVVFVRDTGIGIAPDQIERVFGEFEQVDSSYARTQQGTGLGLALTRRFVELHGGRIWAESEGEGKGSTFTFTIPIRGHEDPDKGGTGNGKEDSDH